jgi:aspartate racemase
MHFAADRIAAALSIPLLDIIDVTAEATTDLGFTRIGLLGTDFTMTQPFYRERLTSGYGLEVLVPGADEREDLHRIIFDELVVGVASDASRMAMQRMIERLAERGAQGVILGCTELMLIADPNASPVPLLDSTWLHAEAGLAFALEGEAAEC